MSFVRLAIAVTLTGGLTGCGLWNEMFGTVTRNQPFTLQAPRVVEAGKPFTVYADFSDNCGGTTRFSASPDPATKVVKLTFTRESPAHQDACPAAYVPARLATSLTLPEPGRYMWGTVKVPADAAYLMVEAVVPGTPVPTWTPPPVGPALGTYPTPTP